MINVVLFEPEIPQNTGNIMRSCVAFDVRLHLIKPLGFSLDEKYIKRSAMDYFYRLDYKIYDNWQDFITKNTGKFYFFTRYGLKHLGEINDFNNYEDVYLVFGKESSGIDKEILKDNIEDCYRIPMEKDSRSLNLSNCVAIGIYEVLRQKNFPNLSTVEVIKEEFLKKI